MSAGLAGRGAAVAGFLAAGYALHRLGQRSGVSDGEGSGHLAGDDLVPRPLWQSTRAITIDAPSEQVWPWLVQMGYASHRAGWYTPYWLDRLVWRIDARSADELRPELQELAVGDRVSDSRDWSVYFTVAEIDPPRALVLHSTRHVLKAIRTVDFSWAFVLHEMPGAKTRLLIHSRVAYTPRWARPVVELIVGPADYVNAGSMLRGIKRRVERAAQEEYVALTVGAAG